MKKVYTAIVERENDGFSISFPDFPGCYSEADSQEDIGKNATEALSGHIKCMVNDGDPIPVPGDLDKIEKNLKSGNFAFFVEVLIPGKTERFNVTTDGENLRLITNYAKRHKMSRSELMVKATLQYICHS